MNCLDANQLKLLMDLKRELEKKKLAPEIFTQSSNQLRSAPRDSLDDLFDRLASQEEGIQYKIDARWVTAPMGPFDGVLFRLAVNVGVGPRKVAIGLPRVPVGISTWLAVSVMISRVMSAKTDRFDFKSHSRQWILIACRERSVRDLYLSQRILFTGQSFVISSFPIYRFRRDGRIQPISLAQPNELSTPVLFYHFDVVESAGLDLSEAKVGLIISEVSELDTRLSRKLLERLENVRRSFDDPKTCIFFNSFDDQMRCNLDKNGYKIINIRPITPIDVHIANIPTLMGTFSRYSCPQRIQLEVVQDNHGISRSLYEGAHDLAKVSEEIHTSECRSVLARWWSLWRTLKDMAVPLEIYERYRVHVQGRGLIEIAIDRISNSADRIYTPEGKSLQSVAPSISNRLKKIYEKLCQSCPKAERIMSLLSQVKSESPLETLFILSEKCQVDALREHFLFTDVDLLDARVPMVHLSQAVSLARTMLLRNCVMPGVWAPWQDSILIAVGASTIIVLMYPYEASLLQIRIQEHIDECALLTQSYVDSNNYPPILVFPPEQMRYLEDVKEYGVEEHVQIQSPEWLKIEPDLTFETLEVEDRILEDEQLIGGLLIRFDDGSIMMARPHSEMLLVTEDTVESVFANTLTVGDTVALMKEDITHSAFQSVLTRVNHLIRVDHRVIDIWRSSIKKILIDHKNSVSRIVQSLRRLGCCRVELTIKHWFRGVTLAPQDVEDIRRVLDLAGANRSAEISKIVNREIGIVRAFNRRLGRRIREKIRLSVTGEIPTLKERIDFEIDEAIEAIEYKNIESIESVGEGDYDA